MSFLFIQIFVVTLRNDYYRKKMTLYCISVFLKNESILKVLEVCRTAGIQFKEIPVTDQTGISVSGFQIESDGLKILVLPCNDFHRDHDFEIGLTAESRDEWNDFVKKVSADGKCENGVFEDGETEYLLLKGEDDYHGNFFFIFDGQKSNPCALEKISCTVTTSDYDFIQKNIRPLLGENLLKKIKILPGESFSVNELVLKEKHTVLFE